MRLTVSLLLVLVLVVPATAAAGAGADELVRTVSESYDAADLAALDVDFPVGELTIEGTDGDRVEVEIRLECDEDGWRSDSCRDRAESIGLDADSSGDRLHLGIDGFSRWRNAGLHVHMTVRTPARLTLGVDMSIGELSVAAMRGDVTIDMGIGEATVRMSAADVAEVVMDAGIGESSLRAPDVRRGASGLFVSETAWRDGRGEARIRVDLGIGEIDVRLS